MKKLIAVLVVAVLGFYVAWPAWSAYRIAGALSAQDEAALDSKVDFVQVRESLRAVVATEIGKQVDTQAGGMGSLGQVLGGDLKKQMLGKIVDQVLAVVVTPRTIIRIANERGDIAASIEKAMREAGGSSSGAEVSATSAAGGMMGQVLGANRGDLAALAGKALGGMKSPSEKAPEPAATTALPAGEKRSFGLGNIKGFGMAGPFGFNVAVARDAAQAKADAVIGMSFTGGDWKLTRVVPNL